MIALENWTEITKGLYRYVIAANMCYEIQLWHWEHDADILTAEASLFIVGDWTNISMGNSFFERGCLVNHKTVKECLLAAFKDNEENNS